MRFWCALLAIAAGLFVQGCDGPGVKHTITVNDREREYFVFAPPSTEDDGPVPLVIPVHADGFDTNAMANLTGYNALAQEEGFIVAYPEAIARIWRVRMFGGKFHRERINDSEFIEAMLDDMLGRYNYDPNRVYAIGMSAGSQMAIQLACDISGRIAAAVSVAGPMPTVLADTCNPTEPVSVMFVQGTVDGLYPFEGGRMTLGAFDPVLGEIANVGILSARGQAELWAAFNECVGNPNVRTVPDLDPTDGVITTVEEFLDCAEGAEVTLYINEGGGHTWPGQDEFLDDALSGPTPHDYSMPETALEFFFRHTVDGT